jgi:IrrE N-terminal-like domain
VIRVYDEWGNVTETHKHRSQCISAFTISCGNITASIGIEVERRDRGTILAGSVQRLADRTPQFHLLLNSKHTEAQQLGTLAHELAQVFCGHLDYLEEGFWPDRSYATKVTRELEAESVAHLVTDRLNLDIGSVQYLAGYLSDDKPPPKLQPR